MNSRLFADLSSNKTEALEEIIHQLNVDQKETLVKYASEWNTNSKHSYVAQVMIRKVKACTTCINLVILKFLLVTIYCNILLQLILSFVIDEMANNKLQINDKTLEGLIAYTNRHYNRLASLLEDIQLLPYTVKLMEPHSI